MTDTNTAPKPSDLERAIERLIAWLEQTTSVSARSEYQRGWNCAIEEAVDRIRASLTERTGTVERLRDAGECARLDLNHLAEKYGEQEFVAPTVCKLNASLAPAPTAGDCPSCGGLNTSCPDGCGRDPQTGELNGTRLTAGDSASTDDVECEVPFCRTYGCQGAVAPHCLKLRTETLSAVGGREVERQEIERLHVAINDAAEAWNTRTDQPLIEVLKEAREALARSIPKNVALGNPRWPDEMNLPCDVSLGELRASAAVLAKIDSLLSGVGA